MSPTRSKQSRRRVAAVANLSRESGGAYHYAIQLLESLARPDPERGFDVAVVDYNLDEETRALCTALGLEVITCDGVLGNRGVLWRGWRLVQQRFPRLALRIRRLRPATSAVRRTLRRVVSENGIDLLLLCAPSTIGFESGIPFVMPIHDLQHRLQPEFPEVSENGEYEKREHMYGNAAEQARAVLVDSEIGKQDVLRCYRIPEERVRVLPFVPSSFARTVPDVEEVDRVRAKYGLPERYFFYPAQFWSHKNHSRLALAAAALRDQHALDIGLVLCGSKKNAYDEFFRTVRELSLDERIHYLGYVPDEDMAGLYAGATALVFPTFFGPTNIPIIEAWALETPVVTSDIRGIREQVGDAALLADPRDAQSLAAAMHRVATEDELRDSLVRAGKDNLLTYTVDDWSSTLRSILDDAL